MPLRPFTSIPYACAHGNVVEYYESDCKILKICRGQEYNGGKLCTTVLFEGSGENFEIHAAEDFDYFINIDEPFDFKKTPEEYISMVKASCQAIANNY